MSEPVAIGAVLYDPKVAEIWDIIRDFFETRGVETDVKLFSNYDLQVDALLNREIDIAWNSPLAWIQAQRRSEGRCRAIAMRDTDRDRVSHFIVKAGSVATAVSDLRGKTIAVGASDSPQATLIPLELLRQNGLLPDKDIEVKRFDVLVGKHGDHIGGELEAFQCLRWGEADACAMLDLNWERWTDDGTIPRSDYRILATTNTFDHCVFTVHDDFPKETERRWLDVLFSMSYEDLDHRRMMDLEGLKQWLPGRTSEFGLLSSAADNLGGWLGLPMENDRG